MNDNVGKMTLELYLTTLGLGDLRRFLQSDRRSRSPEGVVG